MATTGSCDLECVEDDRPAVVVELVAAPGSNFDPSHHRVDVRFAESRLVDSDDGPAPIQHGRCIDDACSTWEIGSDRPGVYEVAATVCGETFHTMVEVEATDDGCHAQTTQVELPITGEVCRKQMGDRPHGPPEPPEDTPDMTPKHCQMFARPSTWVHVARRYPDYYAVADVEQVWYEHDGATHPAMCFEDAQGRCHGWVGGFELAGDIRVFTEYCGTVVEKTVTVDKDADGCHVQTEFVLLEAETIGCLGTESDAAPPTPPTGPDELGYG